MCSLCKTYQRSYVVCTLYWSEYPKNSEQDERDDSPTLALSSNSCCSTSNLGCSFERQHWLARGWRHGPVQCLQINRAVETKSASLSPTWPTWGCGSWHPRPRGRSAYHLPAWPLPSLCWQCVAKWFAHAIQQVVFEVSETERASTCV